MRRLLAASLLFVLFLPAAAAQNQQITAYSDATYPQEWRILNDYWFNATSYLRDERTFHVRFSIPSAGDYEWLLPGAGGVRPDLPNPLAHLMSNLLVSTPGNTPWDLAKHNVTPTFHADGAHDVLATFSYKIRDLSPYEYSQLLDETRQVIAAEQAQWPSGHIVNHTNEVAGFLRLQQVTSDGNGTCSSDTCAGLTRLMERDFDLVFNLVGQPFQLTFHQAPEIPVLQRDGAFFAAGSSYTANAAFDAALTLAGNLTRTGIEVRLDDSAGARLGALNATHPTLRVSLPAGDHQFYYLWHGASATAGTVRVVAARTTSSIRDDVAYQPPAGHPFPWWWLLLALALLLILAWVRRRRFIWYEYQRDALYMVVDRKGRKPDREHRGRHPPFVLVKQPYEVR